MRRTTHIFFLILLTILMTMVWGCREIEVKTEINPDGSCLRSMVTLTDSSELDQNIFHLPYNESWQYQAKTDTIKKKIKVEVNKEFENVEALNSELFSQTNANLHVQARVTLEKRLQGFYKVFHYTEIYRAIQPLDEFKVPLSKYLSTDEIDILKANPDTSIYKQQVEAWQQANLFEEFYAQLLYYHHKNGNAFGSDIENKKEEIFNIFKKIDNNEEGGFNQFARDIAKVLNTKNIKGLLQVVNQFDLWIEQTMESLLEKAIGTFVLKVKMPGIIINTNAESVVGNQAIWEIEGEDFQYKDYEMEVESRMICWKTIIIGLVGIIGLGVLIIFAFFRQNKIYSTNIPK